MICRAISGAGPFSLTRFFTFFAREGVGSPDRDIEEQKVRLRSLLAQADTAAGVPAGVAAGAGNGLPALADTPMDGAVVFLNPGSAA